MPLGRVMALNAPLLDPPVATCKPVYEAPGECRLRGVKKVIDIHATLKHIERML